MRYALTLALLALACGSPPVIRPVPPAPVPEPPAPADAGADAGKTACERAEARLRALRCVRPDGHSYAETRRGQPFAEACAAAMADGRNWKPECLELIDDCSQINCAFAGEPECCR